MLITICKIIEVHFPQVFSRFDLFPGDWFRGRTVLDIGCNVGHLTLEIAKKFEPAHILGIDIDDHLVGVARKNIRHYCDGEDKV